MRTNDVPSASKFYEPMDWLRRPMVWLFETRPALPVSATEIGTWFKSVGEKTIAAPPKRPIIRLSHV